MEFEDFCKRVFPSGGKENKYKHMLCCDYWTTRSSRRNSKIRSAGTSFTKLFPRKKLNTKKKKEILLAYLTDNGYKTNPVVGGSCSCIKNQDKMPSEDSVSTDKEEAIYEASNVFETNQPNSNTVLNSLNRFILDQKC